MNAIRQIVLAESYRRQGAIPVAPSVGVVTMVGTGIAMRWLFKKVIGRAVRAIAKIAARKGRKEAMKYAAKNAATKAVMNPKVMPAAMRAKAAKGAMSEKEIEKVVGAIDQNFGSKVSQAVMLGLTKLAVRQKHITQEDADAMNKGDTSAIERVTGTKVPTKEKGSPVPSKDGQEKEKGPPGPPKKGEKGVDTGKKGKGVKPPDGYEKVPGSEKGAYRRKLKNGDYDYWYPEHAEAEMADMDLVDQP